MKKFFAIIMALLFVFPYPSAFSSYIPIYDKPELKVEGVKNWLVMNEVPPSVSLELSYQSGDKIRWLEVWIYYVGPENIYYYYDLVLQRWFQGLKPSYRGKNLAMIPATIPTNGLTLTEGSHKFFVAFDRKNDGRISHNFYLLDSITLLVSPNLIPTCTSHIYSNWSECQDGNKKIRTVLESFPEGCIGGNPVTEEYCLYQPPCTSWICAVWPTICPTTGIMTCLTPKGSPDNCTGNPPVITQPCSFPCTAWVCDIWDTYCANNIFSCMAMHGTPDGCAGTPPGPITKPCLSDCQGWICDVWGQCQNNGTQTCTSMHSVPNPCNGTPPVLTQNCTPNCTQWTCSVWNACQSNNQQTCQTAVGSPQGCQGTAPTLTQPCTYYPTPTIIIDHWPTYGTGELLTGHIVGTNNPTIYKLLVLLRVESLWWQKPTLVMPYCAVNSSGNFSCNITTGGNDAYADKIAVYLVPADYTFESCFPCYTLPTYPALDTKTFDRLQQLTLNFAGRTWLLKRADYPAGPGPTRFCDQPQCVWVDSAGLHLTIKNLNGQWYGSEVILNEALGYGTYIIHTHGRIDMLDINTVLGMFTWDPASNALYFREFDHELAKWGNPVIVGNAQYVQQPCNACPGCGDNCNRYTIDQSSGNLDLTFYLVWQPGYVEMRTYKNHQGMNPQASDLISKVRFEQNIPSPGSANLRFNHWLFNGMAPANGQNQEVVFSNFVYQSGTPVWNDVTCTNPGITISSCSYIGDSNAYVQGNTTCANSNNYKIAVYILVRGGWWTKPYWNSPLTSINADGSWSCDITTGGVDQEATQVKAYLVPNSYTPPLLGGQAALPAELDQNSIAKSDCFR